MKLAENDFEEQCFIKWQELIRKSKWLAMVTKLEHEKQKNSVLFVVYNIASCTQGHEENWASVRCLQHGAH